MPFADEAFDVVINVESLHCYLSMQRAISEVCRVLRASAHFVLADLRPAEEIPALREQLCSAGLRLVRQEIVTANVFAALDYDHERKRALINEKIPANSCAISTIRGASGQPHLSSNPRTPR